MNLQQLKDGVDFSDLSKEYVPKTVEEESKLEERKQLTKEKLFFKFSSKLKEAISKFQSDDFLNELSEKIEGKTYKSFGTKTELLNLSLTLDHHLDNLVTDTEYLTCIPDIVDDFDA